ncbi:unnamed protein product, partial [Ixodes hexagonus]
AEPTLDSDDGDTRTVGESSKGHETANEGKDAEAVIVEAKASSTKEKVRAKTNVKGLGRTTETDSNLSPKRTADDTKKQQASTKSSSTKVRVQESESDTTVKSAAVSVEGQDTAKATSKPKETRQEKKVEVEASGSTATPENLSATNDSAQMETDLPEETPISKEKTPPPKATEKTDERTPQEATAEEESAVAETRTASDMEVVGDDPGSKMSGENEGDKDAKLSPSDVRTEPEKQKAGVDGEAKSTRKALRGKAADPESEAKAKPSSARSQRAA